MKIQIKYNKTALREFQKKLKVRERALPTLKNKEAALRAMVLEAKKELGLLEEDFHLKLKEIESWKQLWSEFDRSLVSISAIESKDFKVAGLIIPEYKSIEFKIADFSLFGNPAWFYDGIKTLKQILELQIKKEFLANKLTLLDYARKKATQKVNLYEKVQIPGLAAAIKQIKRYLEDEENLAKAGQKLLKQRMQKQRVA